MTTARSLALAFLCPALALAAPPAPLSGKTEITRENTIGGGSAAYSNPTLFSGLYSGKVRFETLVTMKGEQGLSGIATVSATIDVECHVGIGEPSCDALEGSGDVSGKADVYRHDSYIGTIPVTGKAAVFAKLGEKSGGSYALKLSGGSLEVSGSF
ncbi:MAG: hypothetical protein HY921_07755 [Elusimicrobia bacterium]|nr:hypothetical protein [Elusimicrobiota bacterium]